MGIFIALLIFLLVIIVLAIITFMVICRWRIFKKCGKEGFEAIIPYYSAWTFFEISGLPGWVGLLSLGTAIPFIGKYVFVLIFASNLISGISLAKKFNKTDKFGILLAILPIIGYPILAFGKDEYDKTKGEQLNIQK